MPNISATLVHKLCKMMMKTKSCV